MEVMTGLRPSQPLDAVLLDGQLSAVPELRELPGAVTEHVETLQEVLVSMHAATQDVRDHRTRARTQHSEGQEVNFDIGDYVLVAGREPRKLQPFWQGPYRVVYTVNPWVYVVQDLVTSAQREVHVCRIRRYADSQFQVTASIRLAAEYDQVAHVADILAHRRQDGQILLRVRWLGFDPGDDTWEPVPSLVEDVPALVRA